MRKTIVWNEDWIFTKENESCKVTLPHTWNAIDGQGQADYYRGTCVYEKRFAKPEMEENQELYVEFRGVNSSATVFVNDKKAVNHDGGYSTFRANITELISEDNVIRVEVDNSANDRVYPQRADFTFYGGIYRDVYLIVVNKCHFDLGYYGSKGLKITPNINGDDATIDFEAYYTGDADLITIDVDGVGEVSLEVKATRRLEALKLKMFTSGMALRIHFFIRLLQK